MKKYALIAIIVGCSMAWSTAVVAQETTTIKGQVISTKAKDRTLTLRGAKAGDQVRYYVSPEAKITRKGQPADLRMLRRGDIVTITVNTQLRNNPSSLGTIVAVKAPVPVMTTQPAPPVNSKPVVATPPRPVSTAAPAVVAQTPRIELPKTAGSLPLLGLLGAGLLGVSGALARRRRI